MLGHLAQKNETDDEQNHEGKYPEVRFAGKLRYDADQERPHDRSILPEDIEKAEVLIGVFLRNELAEFRTRKSLNTALEQSRP